MGEILVGLLSQPLWVFVAVLARISPPLMLAPPTRSSAMPMRFRALLAVSIALLLAPGAYSTASPMLV